jgi:CRISPR-associated protein Cas1
MAATKTVAQRPPLRKSIVADSDKIVRKPLPVAPRSDVITLFGYGISVCVERGHLILNDGVGDERREGRFARVNHDIRRLVVIGADGIVSLAALRWLADQNASFVMLERDGKVLLTTGPVAASGARLRRAQACVAHSNGAVSIVRDLIDRKLIHQEQVAREKLHDAAAGDLIGRFRQELEDSKTIPNVRLIESQGSSAYWSAWRTLAIDFPKSDLRRIPDHWKTFGSRTSPVSHGARNASNPANAMLNYLYTVLEAETRLTITALGLDPGLGLLHVDSAQQPVRRQERPLPAQQVAILHGEAPETRAAAAQA